MASSSRSMVHHDHQHGHGLARTLADYQEEEALRIALGAPERASAALGNQPVAEAADKDKRETDLDELGLYIPNELVDRFAKDFKIDTVEDEQGLVDSRELIRLKKTNELVLQRSNRPMTVRKENSDVKEEKEVTFGKNIKILTQELMENILLFLDEDSLDLCKVCNSKWHALLLSERLWREFCVTVYKGPAFRKINCVRDEDGTLKPKRFETWNLTRQLRPRVRMESGLYILRTSYVKNTGPPSMWTVEHQPVLLISHYRYLLFLPNGAVLYASTPLKPTVMKERFQKKLFEYHLEKGVCHVATSEQDEDENKVGDGLEFPNKPVEPPKPVGRRKRRQMLLEQQKKGLSKADTIYEGCYTVLQRNVKVTLNLLTFTVAFSLKIEHRSGSNDRLETEEHQSIYHKQGERVINYELSRHYADRCWEYWSFTFPFYP